MSEGISNAIQLHVLCRPTWKNEIKKSPELMKIVLQGGTGDQETAPADKVSNDLTQKRVDVLNAMGFVDNDVLPTELAERRLFSNAHFVRGDQDIKVLWQNAGCDKLGLRWSLRRSLQQ